ncbi:cytochrome c3 family protein [Desulfobacterales bacterium HSG17]|nr:cytochrome c3 family protein [Desulfobacterales bacterium HSG17]
MTRNLFLKKWTIGILAVGLVFAAISVGIASESTDGELVVPLGIIDLEAPEGVEAKRAAVEFPHSQHFSYACQECHHTWDGGAELNGCMTSGCHDITEAPKKSLVDGEFTGEGITYYKYAFHESCVGCHREIKKANLEESEKILPDNNKIQATGPTGCIQCHPAD